MAGTTTMVLLSADFKSFAENANIWSSDWYNDTDNGGGSDLAAQTAITGGKKGVGGKYRTVNDINPNNGQITVLEESGNKYLASVIKAENNYIGFVLDNPIKASNLVLSFDAFMPVDGAKAALRFVYKSDDTVLDSKTGLVSPETTGQTLHGLEFYFTLGNTTYYFRIDNIPLSQTERKRDYGFKIRIRFGQHRRRCLRKRPGDGGYR